MGSTRRELVRTTSAAAASPAAVLSSARAALTTAAADSTPFPGSLDVTDRAHPALVAIHSADFAGRRRAGSTTRQVRDAALHHSVQGAATRKPAAVGEPAPPVQCAGTAEEFPTLGSGSVGVGVVMSLDNDRYCAQTKGVSPAASRGSVRVEGGNALMEEPIASPPRGQEFAV